MGLILLFPAACANAPPASSDAGRWRLRLPTRLDRWQRPLLEELGRVEEAFRMRASRWPAGDCGGAFTILVASDPREAAGVSQRMGLSGDPRGAHTHPRSRLAVLPLPRADALLLAAPLPPATWMQTFRHEAAHLLSLDRPGLRAAPRWFQEGFAEGLAGHLPPPWNLEGLGAAFLARAKEQEPAKAGRPLLAILASLPGEVRLGA
ncbi:MAG: hypothetical protein ACE5H3_03795, partial [Planctomycetota bacterium]